MGQQSPNLLTNPSFEAQQNGAAVGWQALVSGYNLDTSVVHGGSVSAVNCPEGGAAFTLQIPYRQAMRAAA